MGSERRKENDKRKGIISKIRNYKKKKNSSMYSRRNIYIDIFDSSSLEKKYTGRRIAKYRSSHYGNIPKLYGMYKNSKWRIRAFRKEAIDLFVESTPEIATKQTETEGSLKIDEGLLPLALRVIYTHQRTLPKPLSRFYCLSNAMAIARLIGDETSVNFLRFSASYLRALVSFAANDNIHDIVLKNYEEFAETDAVKTRLEVIDILKEYGRGEYSEKLQQAIAGYAESNPNLSKLARLVQAANSIRETLTPATLNTLKREIVKNLSLETEEDVEIDTYGAQYLGIESQTVEFKTSMVYPPEKNAYPNQPQQTTNVLRAICGFLNSQIGGTVYVGVNDQGYVPEDYGVPQTRHRVIIVGIRNDLDIEFKVPAPTTKSLEEISARVALSNIPNDAPNNEKRKLSDTVIERLTYIKPGQNVWQADDILPERLKIKTKTRISQIYRKLDPNKPSYTITASGGGGTFGYHWDNRELTNRERARIQTFPDYYCFVGNYSSVRKQIGMAVPCKLARTVVTAVLNCFAGITYPFISPNISYER